MCRGGARGEAGGWEAGPPAEVSNPAGYRRARTQYTSGTDRRQIQTR
jgi:hypothetical protein